MKLSENLSLAEMLKSRTASRLGISNSPDEEHVKNMKALAENIFQPLRDYFGVPIHIASGYRSESLNRAIGGAHRWVGGKYIATSQHCKGEAIDIDRDGQHAPNNAEIFNYIKDNLEFDQMIWEFGTQKNPEWVHVSYKRVAPNRGEILVAYKTANGRTKYRKY